MSINSKKENRTRLMIEKKIHPVSGCLIAHYFMFCGTCEMYLDLGADTEISAVERAEGLGWEHRKCWTCPECLEKQKEKKNEL